MFTAITQAIRPTLSEATNEALRSPDPYWTASLSKIGMTRIARMAVVQAELAHLHGDI